MYESIATKSMCRFCRVVVIVFGPQYLRGSNEEETAQIMAMNEARGFPKMLGSIAYIGAGRTDHLLGKDCTKVATKDIAA